MKQNDQLKQPFFVKFLESQSAAKSQPGQHAAWPPFTLKIADDFEQTQRYPSDRDDNAS